MSTWIPLKIADLALDEKDKEIAALKAELTDLKSTADRFKAEVERLKNNCEYLDHQLNKLLPPEETL